MKTVYLLVVLVPLAGAAIAGLFGRQIGRVGAHSVTIAGVAIAWMGSMATLAHLLAGGGQTFNETIYTWMVIDGIRTNIPLHQALLNDPDVQAGNMSTRTIEELVRRGF